MSDSSLRDDISAMRDEFVRIQRDVARFFTKLEVLSERVESVKREEIPPAVMTPTTPASAVASSAPTMPAAAPTQPLPSVAGTPKIQIMTAEGASVVGEVSLEIEYEGSVYRGVVDAMAGRIRFDAPPAGTGSFVAKVLVAAPDGQYRGSLGVMIDQNRKMMIDRAKIVVARV